MPELRPITVTVIPSTTRLQREGNLPANGKRRVAGYARVSTGLEEQQTSYEAQVDYYTRQIQANPEWEFIEIYTDEGISATNTKKREGFKRMIRDALEGKIDLILTKSVSRFARNTVDSLTNVRKLKEKGVEVFFEKENIYTMDSKGELLITILSSLAQEESRNLSQNIGWGIRKAFSDGKFSIAYKNFLGYEKGPDGLLKIVEEEAVVVRKIFEEYLSGKTPYAIAQTRMREGTPAPSGGKIWHYGVITSILGNEKYKGDALLQKSFTVDFLSKKMKINEGELPQYYIENSHPAIVTAETFERVAEEKQRRELAGTRMVGVSILSSRIVCGACGGFYGRKVWHAGSSNANTVWHCNNKFAKRSYCSTATLKEEAIKAAFVEAFNQKLCQKANIKTYYRENLARLTDDSAYRQQINQIDAESNVLADQVKALLAVSARSQNESVENNNRYNRLVEQYEQLQKKRRELQSAIAQCSMKRIQVKAFLKELDAQSQALTHFEDRIWQATLHHMTVLPENQVRFVFRDDSEWQTSIDSGVKPYGKPKSHTKK